MILIALVPKESITNTVKIMIKNRVNNRLAFFTKILLGISLTLSSLRFLQIDFTELLPHAVVNVLNNK